MPSHYNSAYLIPKEWFIRYLDATVEKNRLRVFFLSQFERDTLLGCGSIELAGNKLGAFFYRHFSGDLCGALRQNLPQAVQLQQIDRRTKGAFVPPVVVVCQQRMQNRDLFVQLCLVCI